MIRNPTLTRSLVLALLVAALPLPAAGQQLDLDLDALGDQAVERLAGYLRVDTINPPGNETAGVEYLAAIFDEVKGRPHYIVEERVNFPPPPGSSA